MTAWYYQVTGEVIGPVSFEKLKQKADDGEIGPETSVREGAVGPWVDASEVDDLLSSAGVVQGSLPEQEVAAKMSTDVDSQQLGEGGGERGPGIRRSPLALRPCSDCGRMVSKQASTCPSCGRAFHESSFTARYRGEQPVVIVGVLVVLAIGFVLVSPVGVYRIALLVAPRVLEDVEGGETAAAGAALERQNVREMASTEFALAVASLYVLSMLVCTILGGAVGRPRMAYLTGCFLGLFFGPLGVFTSFAIDKRPQCPQCASRLSGMGKECPFCHARLLWKVEPAWY